MSYTGVGITYRPDKLPDGGKPGDILILDANGDPAWSSSGGGGTAAGGLYSVLLVGNSAQNLNMQEVSRISGAFGGGAGHVSYLDLISSTTNGGHVVLHGGVSSDGHTASSLTVAGGLTGIAGGDTILNGGNHANLNTGAHVDLQGGRVNEGGRVSLFSGHTQNGTGAGGSINILGGASQSGAAGAQIFFSGATDLLGQGGTISMRGGMDLVGNSPCTLTLEGGRGTGGTGPGGFQLLGGNSTTALHSGGRGTITGGNSLNGAQGAEIALFGGTSSGGGGDLSLESGSAAASTNLDGGNLSLIAGAGAGTGRRGLLVVPNLPLAVPTSPVAGAVWRTPQGFLTMHPHFCVNWPITFKSVDYTFAIDDGGKMFAHSGDVTARTWTIPSNASVALAPGTAIFLVNHNGAGIITIAIASDVMLLAGVGAKTTIAIAPSGEATLVKIDSTKWIVKGSGLTGLP